MKLAYFLTIALVIGGQGGLAAAQGAKPASALDPATKAMLDLRGMFYTAVGAADPVATYRWENAGPKTFRQLFNDRAPEACEPNKVCVTRVFRVVNKCTVAEVTIYSGPAAAGDGWYGHQFNTTAKMELDKISPAIKGKGQIVFERSIFYDFAKLTAAMRSRYGENILSGPNWVSYHLQIAKAEPALKAQLQKALEKPAYGDSPLKLSYMSELSVGNALPKAKMNEALALAASGGCFKPVQFL